MRSAAGEVWAVFAPLTDEFDEPVLHLEKRSTEVGRAGRKPGLFSPTIGDDTFSQLFRARLGSIKTMGMTLGRRSMSSRELRDLMGLVRYIRLCTAARYSTTQHGRYKQNVPQIGVLGV